MTDRQTEQNTFVENVQKLKELIKDIQITMLVTQDEHGHLHSRPMGMQQVDFTGELWFFTDKGSDKINHIQRNPYVNLAFSENSKSSYVSASGRAEVVDDKGKMAELWNVFLKAWFPDGLETPGITLIRVDVETAEYWDSPSNKVVQLVGFAKAILTGKEADDLGENASVNLQTGQTHNNP